MFAYKVSLIESNFRNKKIKIHFFKGYIKLSDSIDWVRL
jgi:hypothetical protein